MKSLRTIGLTLFLTLGFSFQACVDDYCNCDPYRYFDIEGLLVEYQMNPNGSQQGDTVRLGEIDLINIDYLVDYHADVSPKSWSFSIMNSALACSCLLGWEGSEDESLSSFDIITLNDFDAEHPAGSSIIDQFNYIGSQFENDNRPLSEFLILQVGLLMEEDMKLRLRKAPETTAAFQFQVQMELSTGEFYEVDSEVMFIVP